MPWWGPWVPPFRSRLASLPVRMFPGPPSDYPPDPFHGSRGCYRMATRRTLFRTHHLQAADRRRADLRRRLGPQLLAGAVTDQPLLLFRVELHVHLLALVYH